MREGWKEATTERYRSKVVHIRTGAVVCRREVHYEGRYRDDRGQGPFVLQWLFYPKPGLYKYSIYSKEEADPDAENPPDHVLEWAEREIRRYVVSRV